MALTALFAACDPASYFNNETKKDTPDPEPEPVVEETASFSKGADISWVTEMESKGYKFYTSAGKEMECTALMKEIGFDAVRYRVWVDPADGWCNADDVLVKAKRAQARGMDIMIDFHYSDWWADTSKQNIPAAWEDYDATQMAQAVSDHTTSVLKKLKNASVDVKWVQVGNETNTGMLWPLGSVSSSSCANFVSFLKAGYDAVKAVYPKAEVILHHSNAQELEKNQWFYDIVTKGGGVFDILGLSLYPSYWDSSINAFPDWTPYCKLAVNNFTTLHERYSKPVRLVEFGMPVSEPKKASAALQYLLDGTSGKDWFKGIFLWEPESEHDRNGYDYGAFSGGKPTAALDPFKN